jgi:hypothetical protein
MNISYVVDDIEMMIYLGQHRGQSIEVAKSNIMYFFKHNITITDFDMNIFISTTELNKNYHIFNI